MTHFARFEAVMSVCALLWRFATAVRFMFGRQNCGSYVLKQLTDNISIASEVVSKTRIENCTVYFDNILNANDSALLHRMEDLSKNVNLSIFLQVKAENIFQPAGESSR